jgi:hypothetical protein
MTNEQMADTIGLRDSVHGVWPLKFLVRSNLFLLWVLPVIAVSPFAVACKTSSQLFTANCKADGEVSAKVRESIGQVALEFVQDALGPDTSTAYAMFTEDAKASVPIEQFVSGFQNSIKLMGPFKDLRVAHSYLAKVTGSNEEQAFAGLILRAHERGSNQSFGTVDEN